jgi:hypothetical protein
VALLGASTMTTAALAHGLGGGLSGATGACGYGRFGGHAFGPVKKRCHGKRKCTASAIAQYPDKYIALIQPRDVEDGPPDLTTGKAPPAR